MYSAYKLNKQGDNIQPWGTPFPIWNQSVFLCLFLTVASWRAYRFLKRQIRWSVIPISQNFPQFTVIHTVKGFGIVNQAEIDVFLELSCFFDDLADVGNLISGSSAFSKTSWNIWKFTVHILLKTGLENFEHYFTSVWKKESEVTQSCPTLCDPMDCIAYQAPPSMGFSRQEHWSGLPFPSPMHQSEKWKWSHSVMSDSLRPHGL